MNKIKYNFLIGFTAISCFFGITFFFVSSSILTNVLGKQLKVLPSYTGGEIADDIFNTENTNGLVRYTVHEPVLNAKWQSNSEYWQIVLEYKNKTDNKDNIIIYIDTDNLSDGSTDYLFENENIVIEENHPWDFAVCISNGKGTVYDSHKNYLCDTEYYELNEGKIIKIRIPLQNEYLQTVFGSCKTYHYVFNKLVEVEMHPFAATGKVWKGKRNSTSNEDEEFINKVFKAYAENNQNTETESETLEEKIAFYKEKLKQNPEDYISMANYGSCIALQGGQSSVIKAVALVNQAFEYLDKAAELANGKPGEIEVLMNRGSVAYSVPNDVFEKAGTAADDFMHIISIYKETFTEEELCKPENKLSLAYCYVMASRSYKILGNKTDEILALQEAKKLLEYK